MIGLIKFEIRYPTGQRESAVVEGERALIGSASFCDVRLPMDQAAYEHVIIEVHGGTLRAEAKVESPPATINGMAFVVSALAPEDVLGIGNVRIYVTFVTDAFEGPQLAAKKKDDSNPAIRAIGLVVFAVAAYFVLWDPEVPIAPPPASTIDLFSEEAATCPQTAPEPAVAFADEKFVQADGKRERLPFDVREGVAAVPLYDLAVACYKVGHRDTEAKDAEAARDSLKRAMNDDFRARRLRLEHMLTVKDYDLAKKDVVVLQNMTQSKHGDYVEWLAAVRRRLFPKAGQ